MTEFGPGVGLLLAGFANGGDKKKQLYVISWASMWDQSRFLILIIFPQYFLLFLQALLFHLRDRDML